MNARNRIARFLRICATVALCLCAIALLAIIVDNLTFAARVPLTQICHNKGENGLWLRYYFYANKYPEVEWTSMPKRLAQNQIKYAYFHVLNATADGSLKVHHEDAAKKITSLVHAGSPATKCIAWVYVGSILGGGQVDLMKPAVRAKLIKEAQWLTENCGFDGVQWDYEFCQNGDPGLLLLIEETRAQLPPTKLLSIATPMWYPGTLWGWNDDYFTKVAKHCDQICVMGYDSYFYMPSMYTWLMSQQVTHVGNAVKSGSDKCRVLIGVPTYEDATAAHKYYVESFTNALRGIAAGLRALPSIPVPTPSSPTSPNSSRASIDSTAMSSTSLSTDGVVDGIALFADYTTDEKEWSDYRQYWMRCDK